MSGFECFCGKTTSSESGLWITFKNAHSLKIKGKVKVKREENTGRKSEKRSMETDRM
jgi:hypothetical protein